MSKEKDIVEKFGRDRVPQFLSIADFMSVTKTSLSTVNRKIKAEEIPFTRLGKRILIPASFLKELEDKALRSVKTREGETNG